MKSKLFIVAIAAIILATIASACWGTAKEDEGYTRPAESVEINQLEVVIESDGRIPGDDIPATECAVLPEPTIEDWWGEEADYDAAIERMLVWYWETERWTNPGLCRL